MAGLTVYHRQGAGRPIRLVWTLEEAGADYDLVVMDTEQGKSAEHLARHPLGRVPALVDDEGPLFESTALCLHVAELYPDAGLLPPAGTHARALVQQWAIFAMTSSISSQSVIHVAPRATGSFSSSTWPSRNSRLWSSRVKPPYARPPPVGSTNCN